MENHSIQGPPAARPNEDLVKNGKMEDRQWLKDLQHSQDIATDAMEALKEALEATKFSLPLMVRNRKFMPMNRL